MSVSSLAASDSGAGSPDPQSSPLMGPSREGGEGERGGAPRTGGGGGSIPGLPRVRSHALFLDPEDEEAVVDRIIVPKQINLTAGSPDLVYDMGCQSLQGVSSKMEDRVLMYDLSRHPHFSGCRRAVLVAVLDGHAGSGAVSYLESHLTSHVLEEVARQIGCAPVLELTPRQQQQQQQQHASPQQPAVVKPSGMEAAQRQSSPETQQQPEMQQLVSECVTRLTQPYSVAAALTADCRMAADSAGTAAAAAAPASAQQHAAAVAAAAAAAPAAAGCQGTKAATAAAAAADGTNATTANGAAAPPPMAATAASVCGMATAERYRNGPSAMPETQVTSSGPVRPSCDGQVIPTRGSAAAVGPDAAREGASRAPSSLSLSVEIRTPGPRASNDWCSADMSYGWDEWTADGDDDGEYGDDEGPCTPPWAPPSYHSAAAERRRSSLAAYDSGCGCQPPDPPAALRNALLRCERELMALDCHSGTTALVALMLGASLWLANVGDCRAVVCDDGEARQLTVDHKAGSGRPDAPEAVCGAALLERQRLLALGAQLSSDGYLQVTAPDGSCSDIAVSRNLGCAHLKNRSLSGRGSSWSHMYPHSHPQHLHMQPQSYSHHGNSRIYSSYSHGHVHGPGSGVGVNGNGGGYSHLQQQQGPDGQGSGRVSASGAASGAAGRLSGSGVASGAAGGVRISAVNVAPGGSGGSSWQQQQHHYHHHHHHQLLQPHHERRLHGSAPGSVSGDAAEDPRVAAGPRGHTSNHLNHHNHHQQVQHLNLHHRKEHPHPHHHIGPPQHYPHKPQQQSILQSTLQQQSPQPPQLHQSHGGPVAGQQHPHPANLNRPSSHTQLATQDQHVRSSGRFESRSDPAIFPQQSPHPHNHPNQKTNGLVSPGQEQQQQQQSEDAAPQQRVNGELRVKGHNRQNGHCATVAQSTNGVCCDDSGGGGGAAAASDGAAAAPRAGLAVPPPPPGLTPIATHVAVVAVRHSQQPAAAAQQQQTTTGLSPRPPRPPISGGGAAAAQVSPRPPLPPPHAAPAPASSPAKAAAGEYGGTAVETAGGGRPPSLLTSGDSGSGSGCSRAGSRPGSGSGYLPGLCGSGSGHLLGLPPLPPSPSFATGPSPASALESRWGGPGGFLSYSHVRSGSGGGRTRERSLSPTSPFGRGVGGSGGNCRLFPLPEGGSSSGVEGTGCGLSNGFGGGVYGGCEEDRGDGALAGVIAAATASAFAVIAADDPDPDLIAPFANAAIAAVVGDGEAAAAAAATATATATAVASGKASACGSLRPSVTFSSWTLNSAFVHSVPAEFTSGMTATGAAEAAEAAEAVHGSAPPAAAEAAVAAAVSAPGDTGGAAAANGGGGARAAADGGRNDTGGQGSFGVSTGSGATCSETSGGGSSAAGVLIPDPDLFHYQISQDSEFLICACDGLWDVMRNGEACRYVRRWLADGRSAAAAAEELCRAALKLGSHDNISAVVLRFSGRPLALAASSSRIRRAASEAVL